MFWDSSLNGDSKAAHPASKKVEIKGLGNIVSPRVTILLTLGVDKGLSDIAAPHAMPLVLGGDKGGWGISCLRGSRYCLCWMMRVREGVVEIKGWVILRLHGSQCHLSLAEIKG